MKKIGRGGVDVTKQQTPKASPALDPLAGTMEGLDPLSQFAAAAAVKVVDPLSQERSGGADDVSS